MGGLEELPDSGAVTVKWMSTRRTVRVASESSSIGLWVHARARATRRAAWRQGKSRTSGARALAEVDTRLGLDGGVVVGVVVVVVVAGLDAPVLLHAPARRKGWSLLHEGPFGAHPGSIDAWKDAVGAL